MKKILNLLVIVIFSFLMISCGDNNEGPFETRKENGNLVLYSDNKPAKGQVEWTYTDFNSDITYKISEIEYNKGLPTGKFKYYNRNGELIFDADLARKDKLFKGTIKYGTEQDTILKGEFNINSDWIVTRESNIESLNIGNFAKDTLYDGNINGPNYKFSYKNGKEDGIYQIYSNEGQLLYQCNYIDGIKDGREELYDGQGNLKRLKTYKNGELNGEAIEDWQNDIAGTDIVSTYFNVMVDVVGRTYIINYIKGSYKNGKRDGIWEIYEGDFIVAKISHKDGLVDGSVEIYDEISKNMKKVYYKNGKPDGVWEKYYQNGQLMEKGEYKNGELDGIWKSYYEDGQLVEEGEYKNGKKSGIWKLYYSNSQVWKKSEYKNDKLDGIYEEFYQNSQLKEKGRYKNNEKDGEWKLYYENGQLKSEQTYENGGLILYTDYLNR